MIETTTTAQIIAHTPHPLPEFQTILLLSGIVAVVTWGLIETVKLFFKGWKAQHSGKVPWYYAGALRLTALVMGGASGTVLYSTLTGIPAGWPWGTAIGIGAGGLCTIIVSVIKSRIKKKA